MNEKILVVDDEKEIADLLEVYLKNDNYIVHKYYNGIEALECIQKTEIDLAILDVMLPDIDGSRNTTSGGAGLGLAIAKHIVELHKGTIVAHSKDECIKFIVTLPLS